MSTRTGRRFYKYEFEFLLKCNKKINLDSFHWQELKDLCEMAIDIIKDKTEENCNLKFEIKKLRDGVNKNGDNN